jgi:RecB family exonuclease
MARYDRKAVLSVSSVDEFAECAHRWYLRYLQNVQPQFSSTEARRGTDIHNLLAEYARKTVARRANPSELFDDDWRRMVDDLLAMIAESEQPEYAVLVDAIEKRYGNPPELLPADATKALVEHSFVFRANGSPVRRRDTRTQICFGCTVDLLYFINGGTTAVLRDYKTGRNWEYGQLLEKDRQMSMYAHAVTQFFPDVAEIVIEKDNLRFDYGLIRSVFAREEFEDKWRDVVAWTMPIFARISELEKGGDPREVFPTSPDDSFCSWCPVRAHCPDFNRLPMIPESVTDLTDRSAMTALALQLRRVKQSIGKVESAVRKYIEEEGPIETEGEVLDIIPSTRRDLDKTKAVKILQQHGVPKSAIFAAMTMPLTAMDKLTKGKEPEKKALRQAIKEAISYKTSATMEWKSK